jgi:hypothetical protein
MPKRLFLQICTSVENHNEFFVQKKDAVGKLGIHCQLKVASAIKMLCGNSGNDVAKCSFKVGESTLFQILKEFCQTMIRVFSKKYLRQPTVNDMTKLLAQNEERGFPGMLGTLNILFNRID